MPRVSFKPSGHAVEIPPGASLLDAARLAGVRIRNDCGGKGVCGRCVVQVLEGKVHRSACRHKPDSGYELACCALVLDSDVSVFVPVSSREVTDDVTVAETEPLPGDFPPDTALIKCLDLRMDPPSLDDNVCDYERLLRELRKRGNGLYRAGIGLIRKLSPSLRACGWNPSVIVAVDECGSEILDIAEAGHDRPCLLAVDVGTTAVKAELLAPNARFAASCYNSQVMYGPDVISRIMHCQYNENGLTQLQGAVAGDINRLLTGMLDRAGIGRERVHACVAAGNTTMMHILAGISPLWIRREPYAGSCHHMPPADAAGLGVDINPDGRMYLLPSVSGFVGADITAGVIASGIYGQEGASMLSDLGTNGEIVLGGSEFLVCCSASAGPAFEGEASTSGTRAMPGAIDAVRWDGGLKWSTIGGGKPVGICGSGYIDLLAVLMAGGVVNKNGQFVEGAAECLRDSDVNGLECVVAPAVQTGVGHDIVITQADIDNLLRAKAAIYAAAQVMLDSVGMTWKSLDRIMLAGAFGDRINKENAVRIGLLPDVDRDKIEFAGNTSLLGVIEAAVDEEKYRLAYKLAREMTYFELSTHPDYMQQFTAAKFLPHTKTEQFPSVAVH